MADPALLVMAGVNPAATAECWRRAVAFYERAARNSRQAGARSYYRERLMAARLWADTWTLVAAKAKR